MKNFITKDYLLTTDFAKELYHRYAEGEPIIAIRAIPSQFLIEPVLYHNFSPDSHVLGQSKPLVRS